MKTLKQKIAAIQLCLLLIVAGILSAVPVYAAGASMSASPSKSTVANGATFVVSVYMNGGGNPVNGVEADLSYPAAQLQYVGLSSTGSAFEIAAAGNGGGGSVTIDRGTTGSVTGSGLIATVTFKALVDSGSAAIGIGGSSALVNSGTAVAFSAIGTSVKFGAPAAATTASPSASEAAVATPPAPPKDTTPPVITGVKVASRTPYSATINWTTDEPADSAVDYGPDTNYGLSASATMLVTNHQVTLNSAFLTPEAMLHFHVKSTDAAGNVATGTDQALVLPGVPLTVIVQGSTGKPQIGATVSIDSQTTTTDASGSATLTTGLGSKQIVVTYNGVTVRKPITITRSTKPLPPFRLDEAQQPLNHWMVTSIGLIVVILVLLGLDAVLFGSTFMTQLVELRQRRGALLRHHAAAAASVVPKLVELPVSKSVDTIVAAPNTTTSTVTPIIKHDVGLTVESATPALKSVMPDPAPLNFTDPDVLAMSVDSLQSKQLSDDSINELKIEKLMGPLSSTTSASEVLIQRTNTKPTVNKAAVKGIDPQEALTASVAKRLKPRTAAKPTKKSVPIHLHDVDTD